MQIYPTNPGVQGLINARVGATQAAQRIVNATVASNGQIDQSQLARDFVELKQQGLLFDASAQVIKVRQGNIGSLIDIMA